MSKIIISESDERSFHCPGCDELHTVNAGWTFNGDIEKPTLSPSVLVRSGHYVSGRQSTSCWCPHNAEQRAKGEPESGFSCQICHSFVRDGQIEFLSDCTHALAGQTVDLPEIATPQ